jgi:hypothetical protein
VFRRDVSSRGVWVRRAVVGLALALCAVPLLQAQTQGRFLGREEIVLYGLGLQVQPAQQTVPKGFATIVSTFLQTPQVPGSLPPFAPDAEVRATLRGPSFEQPLELAAKPNAPLNVPILTVPGTHTVENIRLVSGGEVLLYGSPQSVRIDVIEKLLVTTVTARPLTAEEIREKGIVFDKSNYQAYNFTAAFAIEDGTAIDVTFPVVLPTLAPPANVDVSSAGLTLVEPPMLRDIATIIPDTLRIQSRIPNLSVKGFTLTLSGGAQSQDFYVPPIPGVIVIPGDIGFLNQYFSVMLMVANVAPGGSNLVVGDLSASIVLPAGIDNVVGSVDDPLRMAQLATGESPRVQSVRQPGPDGKPGTGDDITTLGPGQTGSAEYLIEGRREGTWPVEMEITGTLTGMPVGPVTVRGRAAGSVLVRNPKFTLTFTHPDVVNAGEPYTLDVTVTNTSEAPANLVSLNLFAQHVSGARLDDEPTKTIDFIAAGDSATVTYKLVSYRTGSVTAATLDSDENIAGRFALKTGVGEFGIPLSPDSLVLPKEAAALPQDLRDAALGLLGRAWAVATAPPAVFPKNLTRFSKKVVLDRAVETAEAGFRVSLGEPLQMSAANLWMDVLGSEYSRLAEKVPAGDTTGLLALLQQDVKGFDLLRRLSVRGDVLADRLAAAMQPAQGGDPSAFHRALAEQFTSRPGHLSVFISTADGSPLPVEAVLVDAAGRTLGGVDGTKTVKEIPFGDVLTFSNSTATFGRMFMVAVPEPGRFTVRLARGPSASPDATYEVSLAFPGADGRVRFASVAGVAADEVPEVQHPADDPVTVAFELAGAGTPSAKPGAPSLVNDPAPTVLGAVQMAEADIVGCKQDDSPMKWHGGRVVAVLFSEEVTAESVQDKLRAEEVSAFSVPDNRVVSVALQPGRRIAYVALREPVGRFVDRSITVQGVTDTTGHALGSATVPITMSVTTEGGVVLGQVLEADGTPAAYAEVRLFYEYKCDEDPVVEGIASQTADAEGRYQFDYAILPPTLKLVVLDSTTDDLRVVRFRVARHSQRLNVNVVFIGRGTLAGRTLAENGAPLANSKIRVTSLTDQSQYGATSDAAGRFEIQRVPVGNIVVEAVNTEHPAQVVISERIPAAGTTVTRDLTLLDVNMSGITVKTGTLTGHVLRSDNVTPVEGVPVVAFYANRSQTGVRCPLPPPPFDTGSEPSECAIAVANTDAGGSFSFPKITAGELRVYSFDQAALQEGQVRVTLGEDQAIAFNVLLGGGFGTVHGVVLDQAGQPVPDAEVGGGLTLAKVNPATGAFTLTDVPVGRREIVAVSQAMGSTGRTVVDIVRQGEDVNATIVLDIVGAVAGRVFNVSGIPQAGVKVNVIQDCYDEAGNDAVCVRGQSTTDGNGAYRVNGLLAGTYRVSAFQANMRDGNIVAFAIRYQAQVLPVDITFRGGGAAVTGRVLRAKPANCVEGDPACVETPLPAKVAISGEQLVVGGGTVGVRFEYVQNFQIVDNDFTTGEFGFSNLWTGPFTVRAAGQFSPEPVAVEGTIATPGQTVNVDLRLQPTSRITGTVYEPDGVTPVTGRQVSLKFKSNAVVVFCHDDSTTGETTCTSIPQGIQEVFAVTDQATGQFVFPIVNAGAFTITANDGSRVAEVKGAVKAGETVDLGVRLLARGRVTVRVIRHNGQTLVPGATVELRQVGYPKAELSGTAADGTITWESLGEGPFAVSAMDSNGFGGRATGRIVGDGGSVSVNVYLYDATGTVEGLVTRLDDEGAPVTVPNAEVVLANGSGPIGFAISDAGGRYSMSLVPAGGFSVDAFDPITAGRGRNGGEVTGGAQNIQADIRLEALGVVRGVLLERGSLAPLKGWQVTLAQATPSGRDLPTLTTTTSVDGSFSFPGASVGSFSLYASRRGVVGDGSASGQVVRAGQLVEVQVVATIVRRVTGRVAGLVANPNGSPAASAQVEICSGEGCRPTTSGTDGRFALDDVPLGRFTVRASAQVTGAPSVGTAGGTLLFQDDVADVTVTLLGLGAVEGTVVEVVNGVRTPAAYASVRLYGQPGSGCPGPCLQSADTNGRFHFVDVPARTFTVAASNGVGQAQRQGSVGGVLNPGETKSGLEVVLEPAVSLGGRVLLSTGTPAAGIVAELTTGGTKLFAESAADGTFTFQAVKAGPFALLLQDPIGPGLAKKSGSVDTAAVVDLGDITLDETPPAVGAFSPADGTINVPRAPEIRITFTEPVNRATVNPTTIVLAGPVGPVTGEITFPDGFNDTVVLFRMIGAGQLASQSRYSIRVSGIEDRLGKKMSGQASAVFTTVDVTPPAIVETTPASAATGVSIESVVRVKFSEIVDSTKFTGPAIAVTGPAGAVDGRTDFILAGTVAVFTPLRPLAEDAVYSVAVAAATDLAGLQSASAGFSFSTTDRTPPQVLALAASNGGHVIENTVGQVAATLSAGDIAFVDFFINDTFAATDRSAPFSLSFQALPSYGMPGGSIRVSAVATDTSGNRGVAASTAVVVDADQAPAATIEAPAPGATVTSGQAVQVRIRGTDDVGATQLGFKARMGATVLGALGRTVTAARDASAVFSFTVPADAAPGVPIVIDGTVADTKGQATAAAPVTVTVVDTAGPVVSITAPYPGTIVQPGQVITAVVTAEDPGRVAGVTFQVGANAPAVRAISPAQKALVTAFSFTVPANAAARSSITLRASAVDASGNSTDAGAVNVVVADSVKPSVTLRTESGSVDMFRGRAVNVVVSGADDQVLSTITLTGSGAFPYSGSYSVGGASPTGTHTFTLDVPANVPDGAIEALTARSTDWSGNESTPVTLTLTARPIADVVLPGSLLVDAGQSKSIAVALAAPSAGVVAVELRSASAGVATVTPSVTFAPGQTAATATVTGISGGNAQLDAYIAGVPRTSMIVTVNGGVVHGTVTDATLQPVYGAAVSIFHGGQTITTVTAGDGTFSVSGVVGFGGDRGFTVQATEGERLGRDDAELDVPNGSATVSVILLPLSVIHGSVFLPDGSTAAGAGVQVDLYESASPAVVLHTAWTNDQGGYEFRLVAPGSYLLTASDTAGNRGRAGTSVTGGGQDVAANVTFLGKGSVTGIVQSGAGSPVADAPVSLRSTSVFGSVTQSATTGADGRFSFSGVFVGSFTVSANDPYSTLGGSTAGSIAIPGGVADVVVQLASYGHLQGTVFRSDGTTIVPGANVAVTVAGRTFETTSDVDGKYSFSYLPFSNTFTVTVNDPATRALGRAVGGFATSGETVTCDVSLMPQGTLVVTVVSSTNVPVNDAAVQVTVQNNGLTDRVSGQTAALNGVDGQLLLTQLLAGPFTATASKDGLSGAASGTIAAGQQNDIQIQLAAPPAAGTITGTVRDGDGVSVATGSVRASGPGGTYWSAILTDGVFALQNVRLGTYRLDAFDAGSRIRATVSGVLVTADGQVVSQDLAFIGLGTVAGVVTNSYGLASGLQVVVQSPVSTFGGYFSATTGAAGHYTISGVPVGPFTIATSSGGYLRAEGAGALEQHGQIVTVNLDLEANTFDTVQWLYDANDSSFAMQPSGAVVAGGIRNVFAPGAARLDIVRDGEGRQFEGGTYGMLAANGRATVGRQSNLHGLNVTRKFFVPESGYFARVLESFTNPTAADITVDVILTSNASSALALFPQATSSGNATVETGPNGDHWVVMDDWGSDIDPYWTAGYGVPISFVFDSANAASPVSAVSAPEAGNQVGYRWEGLTIPAGGTVTLMHFIAQQVNRNAAVESARRLVDLAPEAIEGLDAGEIQSIVNFAVPADGVSTLPPLPLLNGAVSGTVYEGDGVTAVPNAAVSFRSLNPLFGRVWTTTADSGGAYAFVGAARRPVPLDGFEVRAKHPTTGFWSPLDLGALSDAQPAATQNVLFSETAGVRGFVRRHTGAPVTVGTVTAVRGTITVATVPIGSDGSYSIGGLEVAALPYTLTATLPGHPQGTGLRSIPATSPVTAGQFTTTDIAIVPTGTLEGTLLDSGGAPVPSRSVEWYQGDPASPTFRRAATTDAAGRFTSSDMPAGTYTMRSYMPPSNYPVTLGFTITQDATTPVTLSYVLPGTLNVHVLRTNGASMPNVTVTVTGSGFSLSPVTSDASGIATITGIPVGQVATVAVEYNPTVGYWAKNPNKAQTTVTLDAAAGGFGSIDVTLPPFGMLTGTVHTPGGALAGNTAVVGLPDLGWNQAVGGNSLYAFDGIPIGQPINIRTGRSGRNGYTLATATIAADGDVVTTDTRTQALATVAVTVQQADGSPHPNAVVYLQNEFYPFSPCAGSYNQTLRTVANSSGVATFTNISEGPFAVRVYPPNTVLSCYGTNPAVIEGGFGSVSQADDGATVPVTILPASYTISIHGTVTMADGTTPVPSIQVMVLRAKDEGAVAPYPNYFATTNGSGEFTLASATVTGAGVLFRVQSPGGTGSVDTRVPVSASGPVEASVVLPVFRGTVAGQVRTSDGQPLLVPVHLEMYTLNTGYLGSAESVSGSYAFDSRYLPSEGVRVRAFIAGLSPAYAEALSGPITQDGQQAVVNIQLPASRAATIGGQVVTSADGQTGLPSAWIEVLQRGTASQLATAYADGEGRFSVAVALPADGLFTLRAHWYGGNADFVVEQDGEAASQNVALDLGRLQMAVSVVKGVVRFHDGQPVVTPEMFVRLPDGNTAYATWTRNDGTYLFLALPEAALTVSAQDSVTGLSATADITIASATSLVVADLVMPATGTVIVAAVGSDGSPTTDVTVALVSDKLAFERVLGSGEAVDGHFVFTRVPVGAVYVQARRVDANWSNETFASVAGRLDTASQTIDLTVSFQGLGAVTVNVLDVSGNPVTDGTVSIQFVALGSSGPLGSYSRWVSPESGRADVTVDSVPPGVVRIQASNDWYDSRVPAGHAEGALAAGATDPLTVDVRLGTAASFGSYYGSPIVLAGLPFDYSISAEGRVSGALPDGNLWGTLYDGHGLQVDGNSLGGLPAALLESAGRQLVIGPQPVPGLLPLQVRRKVFVPEGGRFARYLDVFTNPTSEAFSTAVNLTSTSESGLNPSITQASPTSPATAVFGGIPNEYGTVGHVFSGAGAPTAPSSIVFSQQGFHSQVLTAIYRVTVPARSSVALLHFVALDLPDQIDALTARTQALAALSEPGALDGLTEEEQAAVVNFREPGIWVVNLRGTLVGADAVTQLPSRSVEVYQELGNKLLATLTSAGDGSGAFVADALAVRGPALILRTQGATGSTVELRVPVSGDGDLPVTFVTDWMYASVRGIVLTSDGSGGIDGGFRVQLLTMGDLPLGEQLLAADSTFAFGPWFMPAAGMKVRVFVPGLPLGFAESPTGPVTASGEELHADVTLPDSVFATFHGRVRSVGNADGIETSAVRLLRSDNRAVIAQTEADLWGNFYLAAALPPDGGYVIQVISPTNGAVFVERTGTAAGQREWIEGPEFELPISTAVGTLYDASGVGVPHPGVFVVSQNGLATFAAVVRANGSFAFYGLPAGTYRLTGQDPATGITAPFGSTFTLDTDTSSVWYLDWNLPATGTVIVRPLDETGQPVTDATLALMSDSLAFERRIGPNDVVTPVAGVYTFAAVPLGPFHLQGRRARCAAPGDCHDLFASADGDLQSSDVPLETAMAFSGYGQVRVNVIFPQGGPTTFQLDALGSSGPLGAYSMTVQQVATSYLFDLVPPGPFHATIRQNQDYGVGRGELDPGAPEPVAIDIYNNSAWSFSSNGPAVFDDAEGYRYSIGSGGAVYRGGTVNGELAETFLHAAALHLNGVSVCCADAAEWTLDWRQLVFGPMSAGRGLVVTRKVYVSPASQGRSWTRYLDRVSNPAGVPVTVTLSLRSTVEGGLSGERSLSAHVLPSESTGGYAVIGGKDGKYASSAYVYAGVNPPMAPFVTAADLTKSEVVRQEWTVTIAPHASVSLLHFVAQRMPGDATPLRSVAQDLAAQVEYAELTGLSEADLGPVINFALPGQHTVGVQGRLLASDGVTPLAGQYVDVIETLGGTVVVSGQTDANGLYSLGGMTVREPVKVRAHVAGLPNGWMEVEAGPLTSDTQQFDGVDLTLPPSVWATVNGTVRATDGATTADVDMARVRVLRPGTGDVLAEALSGRWGQFTMTLALPVDGRFVLEAESPTGSGTHSDAAIDAPLVQGGVVDVADPIVLPITVLFGTVTQGDGTTPVSGPTVIAQHADGTTSLPTHSRPDGTYVFYELLDGAYTLTAQDPATGLTATAGADVALAGTTSIAGPVDWSLPRTGTVVVLAGPAPASGVATVALVSDSLAFEPRIGPNEVAKPDANGRYVFDAVPFGAFHVQGRWTVVDGYGNPHDVYASAHGTLESATVPAESSIDFDAHGLVRVDLMNQDAGPVTFFLEALGSSGPLGTWSAAVEQEASAFQFDFVPPGPVRAVVRQPGRVGIGVGTLGTTPGPSGRPEAVVGADLWNGLEFQPSPAGVGVVDNYGADLFHYPVDGFGQIVSGGLGGPLSLAGTLQNSAALAIDEAPVCCGLAAGFDGSLGGDLVTIGPMTNHSGKGVTAFRKVWIPDEGGAVAGDASGFARILDVLHNSAPVPVTVTVRLTSVIGGAQAGARSVVERSADLAADGGFVVIGADQAEATYGASAYVYSGASPPLAPSLVSFDFRRTETARTEWTLTLGPGESKALMHFVIQREPGNVAGAAARARALAADVANAGNTLAGLTVAEKQMIVNFVINP